MTARLAYPLDEAAVLIGVSEMTLRREIKAGRVRARRVRGRVVVLHAEIERYLARTDIVLSDAETERVERTATRPKRGKVTRLIDISGYQAPIEEAAL